MRRIRVLFVCLGNICRSPLAEAVFREEVRKAGLGDRVEIDSAGTSDYHIGDPPDPRTVRTAAARGVRMDHRARQLQRADFDRFDYILAMDASNLQRIRRLGDGRGHRAEVALLRAYDPEADDGAEVPDPYYGGERGFEDVHDIVERACRALLEQIVADHGIG